MNPEPKEDTGHAVTGFDRRGFLAAAAALPPARCAPPKEKTLEGIFVIMQTPFLESLEIGEESLRRESDFLARVRPTGSATASGGSTPRSSSGRWRGGPRC
jgi:hypothetical protein